MLCSVLVVAMGDHPLTRNLVLQKAKADQMRLIRRLNVCGAQIDDISTLAECSSLEVLSLSVNEVSDLSALSSCQNLAELYLRQNDVCDLKQVLYLAELPRLRVLNLTDNPISQQDGYREFVIAAVPTLSKLDEVHVHPDDREDAQGLFPDPFNALLPLPVPTKKENRGAPQHSSPLLKSRLHAQQAKAAAAERSASTTPPAAEERTTARTSTRHEDPESSSGIDVDSDNRYADANQRAVVRRPQTARAAPNRTDDGDPPMIRRPARQPPLSARGYRDSPTLAPPVAFESEESEDMPSRRSSRVAQGPPKLPLGRESSPADVAASIREENVVRAIQVLLGELSATGLSNVRKHLDALEGYA